MTPYQILAMTNARNTGTENYLPRSSPCVKGLRHKNFISSEKQEEKKLYKSRKTLRIIEGDLNVANNADKQNNPERH